ncbi:hypothetical protein OSTOST_22510, partial [Ostertagia ostertagi]
MDFKDGKKLLWREICAEIVPRKPWFHFGRNGYTAKAKLLLNHVSGYAEPGQVTFIMGASTLVEWGDMKKLSAYVQQEDLFISQATVEEQLMFTARSGAMIKRTEQGTQSSCFRSHRSYGFDCMSKNSDRKLFCEEPNLEENGRRLGIRYG